MGWTRRRQDPCRSVQRRRQFGPWRMAAWLLLAVGGLGFFIHFSPLIFAHHSHKRGGDGGVVFFGEGVRLTAFFADEAVRLVFSDGQEVWLPQRVSASGARFTDGDTLFWNKGDEARLEWRGNTYETRVATPGNDVWERARVSGIDFRGVGTEPGWVVEIRHGEGVHLLLDYGTTVMTMPLSEYRIHFVTGERTYVAERPWAPVGVVVSVTPQVCYDGMSGEGFLATVTVALPDTGLVYHGCGRDL